MDILIYIDELPTSNDTLALATLWLEHIPARVTVMTPAKYAAELRQAALARLPAKAHGSLAFEAVQGRPRKIVCKECETGAYDLLIVAPAGHSRLDQRIRGSRIRRMVHDTNTSVLVARQAPPAIRRILVGVGTAEHALIDVRVAVRLAQAFQAELTMVHVASQVPLMFTGLEQMRMELDSYLSSGLPGVRILAAARQIIAEAGLEPRIHLREGLVHDQLVDEARGYDLLVIGAHTGQGWMSLMLDDIADHVVRYCPVPTLVVRSELTWTWQKPSLEETIQWISVNGNSNPPTSSPSR
ncbi:MAG: universal stress protein [Anaerolineae bacterium]|nr:universal stress protein [Anaerolineae bacterium]